MYASILELLGKGRIIAIDIDIRLHNKAAIKNHPLSERIDLVEGSSVDEKIVKKVKAMIKRGEKVLVVLDSDHSADHVRREIKYYSPLVTTDSYMVVMDGVQEKLWDVPSGKEEWRYDKPPWYESVIMWGIVGVAVGATGATYMWVSGDN